MSGDGGGRDTQYFAARPQAKNDPREFVYAIETTATPNGGQAVADIVTLTFATDAGVFSHGKPDAASELLVRSVPTLRGRVMDLGCGYGFVGIALAARDLGADGGGAPSFAFCDVNERAVALCRKNIQRNRAVAPGVSPDAVYLSDGFANVPAGLLFDAIATNPPIHAGKPTVYRLFAESRERLAPGGALYVVIAKRQGADSARAELARLFGAGHCADIARKSGFHVFMCHR